MVKMVEQKGVFCYDYIDKYERLAERTLPPREQFLPAPPADRVRGRRTTATIRPWRDRRAGWRFHPSIPCTVRKRRRRAGDYRGRRRAGGERQRQRGDCRPGSTHAPHGPDPASRGEPPRT